MKKILIAIIITALSVSIVHARRKSDKAGSVKDNIYTDKKYDFKLTLNDAWKLKVKANKSNFRLVLVQKNYEVPGDYIETPDYTMVPRIVLWVDTSTNTVFSFMDSLLKRDYSSDQKKELFKEFEILMDEISEQGNIREKRTTRQKKALKIDGNKALLWTGQMRYRKEIALSASSLGGKRVTGAYGGAIIGIKKNGHLYLFHMICEWIYFQSNLQKAMEIITSIDWEDTEA